MKIVAFAGSPALKVKVDANAVLGRVSNGLRGLKISHSKLRIVVGMLRESVDAMNRQVAQQRADIHDLESTVKRS